MTVPKYALITGLVLTILIGLVGMAIAAVTEPLELPPAEAVLSVDSDQVQLKKSGSETWTVITSDTQVGVGDTVWTNTTGGATITLFDQGVIRLDADTTVTLERADIDPEHPEIFHGQIFLEQGQLWSRVFSFISPESSYEVRTSSTVATVRGTIFDVWQHGEMSGVYVEEHSVHVTNDGHEAMVEQGDFMNMDPRAKTLMDMNATMSDDMQAWVGKNRERDEKFDQAMAKKLQGFARRPSFMQRLAEKVRLAASTEDKAELEARFKARAMMHERMTTLTTKKHEKPADPTPNLKLDSQVELRINSGLNTEVEMIPLISR